MLQSEFRALPVPVPVPPRPPQWLAEDFEKARNPVSVVVDPWEPPAKPVEKSALNGLSLVSVLNYPKPVVRRSPHTPTLPIPDPWDPAPAPKSFGSRSVPIADPWDILARGSSKTSGGSGSADLNGLLPIFDPELRQRRWERDVFEKRFTPTPRMRAHWVVAMLSPATAQERNRLERRFESIFAERPEQMFFRKVLELATDEVAPYDLLAAAEFKMSWDASPGLWFYRPSIVAAPQCGAPGRKAMTWPKALRISDRRGHCRPSEMIADEWLDDWMKLHVRDNGYWNLADYALFRACEDEFNNPRELWRWGHEDRVWAREAPTPHIASSQAKVAIIAASGAKVPERLHERFLKWRERQNQAGKVTVQ